MAKCWRHHEVVVTVSSNSVVVWFQCSHLLATWGTHFYKLALGVSTQRLIIIRLMMSPLANVGRPVTVNEWVSKQAYIHRKHCIQSAWSNRSDRMHPAIYWYLNECRYPLSNERQSTWLRLAQLTRQLSIASWFWTQHTTIDTAQVHKGKPSCLKFIHLTKHANNRK